MVSCAKALGKYTSCLVFEMSRAAGHSSGWYPKYCPLVDESICSYFCRRGRRRVKPAVTTTVITNHKDVFVVNSAWPEINVVKVEEVIWLRTA